MMRTLGRLPLPRLASLFRLVMVGMMALSSTHSSFGAEGPPAWAMEEMRSTEGRWVADNSAYKSTEEPYDAYGLEWQSATGGTSITGRLFGLKAGKELGTFWEYRLIWHPERETLWLFQFGTDGTFGEGALVRTGPASTELEQTFYSPSGSMSRSGHRETKKEGQRITKSFGIDADGTWTPRREYVWVKEN